MSKTEITVMKIILKFYCVLQTYMFFVSKKHEETLCLKKLKQQQSAFLTTMN